MITKGQWKQFCSYVDVAKQLNMEPYMKGQRVFEVDTKTNEIVTIDESKTRIRYKHPNSFENYQDLNYLFSTITFNRLTSLKQIMRFTNTAQLLLKKRPT